MSLIRIHAFRNGTRGESNPFEEEEWDEDGNDALVDTGEPGIPVKALYDYVGAESDELSFKQGKLPFLSLAAMRILKRYPFLLL